MSGLAMNTVAAAWFSRINVPLPASMTIGAPLAGTWLTDTGTFGAGAGDAVGGVGVSAAAAVA
jgi:hypothetical protein